MAKADLIDELKKLVISKLPNHKIYFSHSDLPSSLVIPDEWSGFGVGDTLSSWFPAKWNDYASRLPTVLKWLRKCVLGTAVISDNNDCYLAYIYAEDENIGMYFGGLPLKYVEVSSDINLPSELKNFYDELHNGFFFYVDRSMGPSSIKDFASINDLREDDTDDIDNQVGIFSNGMGDYITMVRNDSSTDFYIWWHEDQNSPDCDVEVWPVMDAWMGIFLENSNSNEWLVQGV